MNRRLFNFVAAASLALFAVVGALWARSFASETILLESRRGQCLLIGVDCSPKAVREYRDATTIDVFLTDLTVAPTNFTVPISQPTEHRGLGFLLVRGYWYRIAYPGQPFWIVGIPYWFIALLTVAAPALWLWRRLRSMQRGARGLCPTCGYDLRATPERRIN